MNLNHVGPDSFIINRPPACQTFHYGSISFLLSFCFFDFLFELYEGRAFARCHRRDSLRIENPRSVVGFFPPHGESAQIEPSVVFCSGR